VDVGKGGNGTQSESPGLGVVVGKESASRGLFMAAIHEDTVKARRGEAIKIGE
jgi:hypothetical protein